MATAAELRDKYKVAPAAPAAVPKTPLAKSLFDKFIGAGEAVAKKTYDTVNNFLPAKGQTIPSFIASTIKDIPTQLSEQVGQPQIRAYASIPSLIGKTLKPQGQFQEDLYGTNKPLTLERTGRETLAQNPDAPSKTIFGKVGFPAVGFLAGAADLIPGGEGAKRGLTQAVRASDAALDEIARSTSKLAISTILKTENPEITDEALKVFSPQLASAKNPEEVKKVINYINTKVKDVAVKAEKKAIVQKATEPVNDIPEHLKPLAEEAKKYKTADEFISSKTNAYHGTNADFNAFDLSKAGTGNGSDMIGRGIYVAKSPEKAAEYGKKTLSIHVPEDAKIVDWNNMKNEPEYGKFFDKNHQKYKDKYGFESGPGNKNWLDHLKDDFARKYYDGVDYGGTQTLLFDPKNALTEKQLRDLHTQATKGSDESVSPDLTYSPTGEAATTSQKTASNKTPVENHQYRSNLIRSISAEDLPGPITERLSTEFPSVSTRALEPIAKRLAKLHRTSDIEGILDIVHKINTDINASRSGKQLKFSDSKLKIGSKEAVGDLPPAIGELMSSAERGKYLDNIGRSIKDREQAVLAQHEYDALWDHADQKILDRYQELKIERDIMRDALSTHSGKELNDLYKGTFKSPKDVSLDELINQSKGKRVDTRIDEILGNTGGDIQGAQKTLDEYHSMRESLKEIESDIREIRPKARAARILQDMVEDVPIISRRVAGEITGLANPQDLDMYKDISGFSGQTRDLTRNFKAFFGDRFSDAKSAILDPFDKAKGNLVDELNKMSDSLDSNIVKKFKINRGSPEDSAIQQYGDTSLHEGKRLTLDALNAKFGGKRAGDIIDADTWFRNQYKAFLKRVNMVRADIYPNDPSKLIPERKDYYRHYKELSDGVKGLIDMLEIKSDSVFPHEIHPKLSGISEFTKPNSKWASFAQTRSGKGTDLSAIGGFLDYAPAFAYAVHIDPFIGQFRYLRRELANIAPVASPLKMGETRRNTDELIGNFLSYLDDFAGDLAGKTNPMDRYLQKAVPGGRKTFKVIDWINSRVKANTILGNMSSSIAQAFNVPQGLGSAKMYSFNGAGRTLASIFSENEPMKASTFIKERFQEDLKSKFKLDWISHPIVGSLERTKDMAVWLTSVLDEVGTKYIWNSHYEMAKDLMSKSANGTIDFRGTSYDNPVKLADDYTRSLVGGRGIGEKALIQKSKVFQLVAPFQLEVANLWHVQGDFLKQKDYAALAIFFAASYLMNRGAEAVRGTPVTFDPIQALIDGSTQASDELEDTGDPVRAAFKFTGRQVGEILSNLPVGQTVAQAVPDDFINFASGGTIKDKKDFFGTADPGRFGGGLLAIKSLSDPLYKLLPPFGGAQAKRTIEGIKAMLSGEVRNKNNDLSFKVKATPMSVAQAFLFGQNATPEARKFYAENDDLFQRVYRQDLTRTQENLEAEKSWSKMKKYIETGESGKAADVLDEAIAKNPDMAQKIADISAAEDQGLNGNDRLIKMLGVENGERAKYIANTLKTLKTANEKADYIADLAAKGLMNDQVVDQVSLIYQP